MLFALQYVRAMWTADIAGMVLGQPHRPAADKGVTVLMVLLPLDASQLKPALQHRNVQKNALAALERFLQARAFCAARERERAEV